MGKPSGERQRGKDGGELGEQRASASGNAFQSVTTLARVLSRARRLRARISINSPR